ncbi:MAG: protein-disulfide reductase DsbD [Steroidobacteraceae bacterium]
MSSIPALPARWFARLLGLLLPALTVALPAAAAEDEFLPVRSAFKVALAAEPNVLVVDLEIAPGYYLYRDRLGFESATPGVTLGQPTLPVGLDHEDEFFGKQIVYRDMARVGVPVTFAGAAQDFDVKVKLQGCADAGLCYPPQTWTLRATWPAATAGAARPAPAAAPSAGAKSGGLNLRSIFGSGAKSDADFLPVDQAFVFSAESTARDRIQLRWDIADDYYLYRDKVTVKTSAQDVQLGKLSIPGGESKHDEYFGEQVVFHGEMVADLPVAAAAGVTSIPLEISYQGCADAGLCYPPVKKTVVVQLASTTAVAAAPASGNAGPMRSEQDLLADKIREGSLLAVIGLFFVAGLGLALTPCVWPMVPILSGIIVGAGAGTPVSRGRAFALSLAYVLGMAFTYTVAGAAFAAAGQQAQAFFQEPWMILLFAGLFVWLALGMFGVFNLQLPAALQSRLSNLSNQQRQGTLLGTAIVGALSSLIVTACVAPPLVASLAVISQTGDVLRGGLALFALSLGMGAPLLLIGASAGQFLPKAGPWMDTVKQFFGIMMLGVAIWMVGRILPGPVTLALWAALAFITGYWLLTKGGTGKTVVVRRALGALAAIYGVLLLVGALSGRSDPLQPLAGVSQLSSPAAGGGGNAEHHGVPFQRIKSVADLDSAIAAAQASGKTVMLDFYADWCVSCKEMEKYTFPDAAVQAALANTVLLQADVTANDDVDQALMQRFGILGPPSILFFGRDGVEKPDYRVVGFKPAADFAPHIQQAIGSPSS